MWVNSIRLTSSLIAEVLFRIERAPAIDRLVLDKRRIAADAG
jgi:hypothetical protein